MKTDIRLSLLGLATALVAVAGCFDEPVPAAESVKEGQRVYLKNRALSEFTLAELKTASTLPVGEVDYLNLDYNELTNIDAVAELTGLKWLRLNGNRLETLPDLSGLKSLRRLYLRGNRFAAVPETVRDLKSLTDLDLSGNPITEIPEWLAKTDGLENLSFNHTKLTRLPDDLSHWRSLKTLQLGGLELSFEEMTRIRAAFDPKGRPLGTTVVF